MAECERTAEVAGSGMRGQSPINAPAFSARYWGVCHPGRHMKEKIARRSINVSKVHFCAIAEVGTDFYAG